MVHGLTRVRGMTQDDSHIYFTPRADAGRDQHLLDFVLELLRDFGLDDFYLELSTRDDRDKFIGSDEEWEEATETLREAARAPPGCELVPDPGGAAFYGPKISVQAQDAIGRTWQMSTIQYDFNQPERFGLEYTGRRRHPAAAGDDPPAKFGSIERFFGVLARALRRRLPGLAGARCRCSASRSPTSTSTTWTSVAGELRAAGHPGRGRRTPTTGCRRRSATPASRRCRSC